MTRLHTDGASQWWQSTAESKPPEGERVRLFGAKRLLQTVGRWTERDGWEQETAHDWLSMYTPTHWRPLDSPFDTPPGQRAVMEGARAALDKYDEAHPTDDDRLSQNTGKQA